MDTSSESEGYSYRRSKARRRNPPPAERATPKKLKKEVPVEEEKRPGFVCPFNTKNHFLLTLDKFQAHIKKCGDRKGKSLYRC